MGRILALVLALPALVLGCGSEGAGSDGSGSGADQPDRKPVEVVTAAAIAADDSGGARIELRSTTATGGLTTETRADGVVDFDAGSFQMTAVTDMPGFGKLEMEQRGVEGVVYQRWSQPSPFPLPGGAEWVEFDVAALLEGAGADPSQLGGMPAPQDPTDLLARLRAAGDVTEVGPDEIDGVATTEYLVTVDVAAALEEGSDALGEDFGEETRAFFESLSEAEARAEIRAWIDADGLPRRLEAADAVTLEGLGTSESLTTLDITDYGVAVEVTPPPPEATVSLSEVLADLGSALDDLGGVLEDLGSLFEDPAGASTTSP